MKNNDILDIIINKIDKVCEEYRIGYQIILCKPKKGSKHNKLKRAYNDCGDSAMIYILKQTQKLIKRRFY